MLCKSFKMTHNILLLCQFIQMVQGIVDNQAVKILNLVASKGQILDILVENHGRMNYGSEINDQRKVICKKLKCFIPLIQFL